MKRQTIYYTNYKDNFTKIKIKTKKIDENYKYINNNFFYKILAFILYRLIAFPLSFIFLKFKHNIRIKNKKILKNFKNQGFFVYGNHSMAHADPFIPTHAFFPKRNYIIVHPDNISQFLIGNVMPMLGALPLPDDFKAYKNFINAIYTRIKQNHIITIYPEASIWPYYNSIRPFPSTSFYYPIKFNSPVFCITNTFQKKKFSSKPKVVTYIDGPFYPDTKLDFTDQKNNLRDKIYSCMKSRCDEFSNYEYIKYIKKDL